MSMFFFSLCTCTLSFSRCKYQSQEAFRVAFLDHFGIHIKGHTKDHALLQGPGDPYRYGRLLFYLVGIMFSSD
jgi:hypothetical protein